MSRLVSPDTMTLLDKSSEDNSPGLLNVKGSHSRGSLSSAASRDKGSNSSRRERDKGSNSAGRESGANKGPLFSNRPGGRALPSPVNQGQCLRSVVYYQNRFIVIDSAPVPQAKSSASLASQQSGGNSTKGTARADVTSAVNQSGGGVAAASGSAGENECVDGSVRTTRPNAGCAVISSSSLSPGVSRFLPQTSLTSSSQLRRMATGGGGGGGVGGGSSGSGSRGGGGGGGFVVPGGVSSLGAAGSGFGSGVGGGGNDSRRKLPSINNVTTNTTITSNTNNNNNNQQRLRGNVGGGGGGGIPPSSMEASGGRGMGGTAANATSSTSPSTTTTTTATAGGPGGGEGGGGMDGRGIEIIVSDETGVSRRADKVTSGLSTKPAVLRRIGSILLDNRLKGRDNCRQLLSEHPEEYRVLKKVLNIMFVTVGVALLVSVFVVIVYTSVGEFLVAW